MLIAIEQQFKSFRIFHQKPKILLLQTSYYKLKGRKSILDFALISKSLYSNLKSK